MPPRTCWGELLYWPVLLVSERLSGSFFSEAGPILRRRWQEQHELRRLYREDYAGTSPPFAPFCVAGAHASRNRRRPIRYNSAIRLMGLPEHFTRDDLKRRFNLLIAAIHPRPGRP